MNNKGSLLIYAMMVGLVVILLGLWLAPSVVSFADTARTSMDCTNSSISNFDKAACTVTDLSIFYIVGGIILIGGVIVTSRIIFGGE